VHANKSSGRVGVACANLQLGKLVLFEFADDTDGSVLESVLVQQGVREVLVAAAATPSEGPAKKRAKTSSAAPSLGPSSSPAAVYDGFLRHAFLRAAVAVTLLPSESFITAPVADLMASLTAILMQACDVDVGGGPYDLDLANAKNMRDVHPAIAALFAHLELGNSASARGYTLELGLPEEVMCYDASVSHALSVFPENGGSGGSGRAFDLSELGDEGDGAEDEAGAAEEDSGESGKGKGSKAVIQPSHTLFALLNHCKTKMGSRLLRQWMQQPLRNPDRIKTRLDAVAALVEAVVVRNSLRDGSAYLLRCPDLEKTAHKFRSRGASRASLMDMLTVYRAALRLQACCALAKDRWPPSSSSSSSSAAGPAVLLGMEACSKDLSKFMALVEELVDSESLKASSSGRRSEGSLWGNKWVQVRPSMSPELEKLATQLSVLRGEILAEHKRAAQVAGVDLKQMHLERSAVHGLHLRVTKKDATKALKALDKEGCKTLSSQKMGTLFLTAKLGRLVASHEETRKRFDEEQAGIVRKAVEVAATYFPVMQRASALVAELDCLCCLAHVAATNDWVRPTILSPTAAGTGEDSVGGLHLVGLRHPIVEALVGRSKYIASDLDFRLGKRTAIITGPNMGGKSTYIRAVGLTVLLSHMGSFVPCTSASIPCYDRLLARVGASDSTMAGLSTFMAECVDVAKILKRASRSSLVIADELGRGTSSHDGFGIAWAVIERLATETKATSLFATHFHELNDLATLHPSDVVSLHVSAHVDDAGKVTMLFAVEPGAAERSYGVACARLAHFPSDVLIEATALVESMEKQQQHTF